MARVEYPLPGEYVAICYNEKRDGHDVISFEFPSEEVRFARRMKPLQEAGNSARVLAGFDDAFKRRVKTEHAEWWFTTVLRPELTDRFIVVVPKVTLEEVLNAKTVFVHPAAPR
jgi:hypothetical protein